MTTVPALSIMTLVIICMSNHRHTDNNRSDMTHGTKATDLKCSSTDRKKRILNWIHIILSNVNFYKVLLPSYPGITHLKKSYMPWGKWIMSPNSRTLAVYARRVCLPARTIFSHSCLRDPAPVCSGLWDLSVWFIWTPSW